MTTSVRTPDHTAIGRRRSLFVVGAAAIFFPLVYLLSDLIEVVQGDFSTFRLTLTYIGEAGFPLFVIGLCALVRDRLPWWGLLGGIAYAYLVRSNGVPAWTGDVAFVGMGIVLIRRGIPRGRPTPAIHFR